MIDAEITQAIKELSAARTYACWFRDQSTGKAHLVAQSLIEAINNAIYHVTNYTDRDLVVASDEGHALAEANIHTLLEKEK